MGNLRMFIAGEAEGGQVFGRQGGSERVQGRKELETPETGDADKNVLREQREVENTVWRADKAEALEVTGWDWKPLSS